MKNSIKISEKLSEHLKQISREELSKVQGGVIKSEPGDCGSMCSPGDGQCEQYGLHCGIYMLSNAGTITSTCMKCL